MEVPRHQDILLELKEVSIKDYHQLGLFLDISTTELNRIEYVNQQDPNRQLSDIIDYWQKNGENYSWGALATALEKVGRYGRLVHKLRDLDGSSKTNKKNTTAPEVKRTTTDNQPRDTPTNESTDILSPGEDTDTSAPDPQASGVETRLGYVEKVIMIGGAVLAGAMVHEGVSALQNRKREREPETEDPDGNSSKPNEDVPKAKQPKKT